MAPAIIRSTAELEEALARAQPGGPGSLPEPDAGAVLALAAHCVAVSAGFRTALPGGAAPAASAWTPHSRWAQEFTDEWVFRYSHPGRRNTLTLHLSLQRATGRMLVHTFEGGGCETSNTHLLGLSLERYVPPGAPLRAREWAGTVACGDVLGSMMLAHVLAPLLAAAAALPRGAEVASVESWPEGDGAARGRAWRLGWGGLTGAGGDGGDGSGYIMPAAVALGVTVAVVAVVVAVRRRRQR